MSHAHVTHPDRLFRAETTRIVVKDFSKLGVFDLTLIEELPVPAWVYYKDWRVMCVKRVFVQMYSRLLQHILGLAAHGLLDEDIAYLNTLIASKDEILVSSWVFLERLVSDDYTYLRGVKQRLKTLVRYVGSIDDLFTRYENLRWACVAPEVFELCNFNECCDTVVAQITKEWDEHVDGL